MLRHVLIEWEISDYGKCGLDPRDFRDMSRAEVMAAIGEAVTESARKWASVSWDIDKATDAVLAAVAEVEAERKAEEAEDAEWEAAQ